MSLSPAAVCLDAQGAQSPEHHDRGIARYVVEHAAALCDMQPDSLHSVLLNPSLPLAGTLNWLLGRGLLGWTSGDRRAAPQPSKRPAIYHVMSPFELQRTLDELWPEWARRSDLCTVVTLYDLIPLVFPEHYLRDPVIRTRYHTRAELVRNADRVVAISETTARDARELLGIDADRIDVIHAAATRRFSGMYESPSAAWEFLSSSLASLKPGFVLYVAGFEFRKNLQRVVSAYGRLSADLRAAHQLVIACRMLPREQRLVREWAASAGLDEGDLLVTGYVTDAQLGALYRTCELFLFASIYEGSGLPMLEAMSCEAPVIASNTSTGPEILGGLEGTFDPYDPASIAACLESSLTSREAIEALVQRSRARARCFSWDRVARDTLKAYEATIDSRRVICARRRRPRIALVTPWPPERSGVADYNLRLAEALGRTADVDVVVPNQLDQYAPPLERGVRLRPAELFRAAEGLHQPDRVVYSMGNSSYHRHVYELLRERPGAVVAHDVRLTGFYGWFAGVERPEDPSGRLAERIEALYGPRLPKATDGQPPTWQRQDALGLYMTREIQQYADALFVHSRYAAEVLELDRGILDRRVPVTVLPFGMPAPPPVDRMCRPIGDDPIVVTAGVVSEVKGLASLIAACALVARGRERLRLVVAGPGEESELIRWQDFARDAAPGVRVELTGYLHGPAYTELLQDADVAVQLRTLSNGEASASVADCLAAGVPTIVSDLGWASELPATAVVRVPGDPAPVEVADQLEALLADANGRQALSEGAADFASSCNFERVADHYIRALQLD